MNLIESAKRIITNPSVFGAICQILTLPAYELSVTWDENDPADVERAIYLMRKIAKAQGIPYFVQNQMEDNIRSASN